MSAQKFGYEIPGANSEIIGDNLVKWFLVRKWKENGKEYTQQESPEFYAENDNKAKEAAKKWFVENGGRAKYKNGLEIRIFG